MHRTTVFVAILLMAGSMLPAQTPERGSPRSLTGTLSFGWLDTETREVYGERRSNPFSTLNLDYHDSLLDPGILSFRIQPRFSTGYLDALTGMSEGSGVSFDATFLPFRPFPLRFHYSRFQRAVLTQGLGTTYSRFQSQSHDSNLGFEWVLALPHRPQFTVSFNKVDVATQPELALTQGFETRARTLSFSGQDFRRGWTLSGNAYFQKLNTQYLVGANESPLQLASTSNVGNVNVSAQRSVAKGLDFQAAAYRNSNRTEFDNGLFNQTFDSVSAKLNYRPGNRLQAWTMLRDNRSGVESLGPKVAGGSAFNIPRSDVGTLIFDNEARVEVYSHVTVLGRSEFTRIDSSSFSQNARSGNYLNTVGGAQYFRPGRVLSLSASYYFIASRTRFERASSGNLIGHSADGAVTLGTLETLRSSVAVSISRSRENIRSFLPYFSSSENYHGSLSRGLARFCRIELQGSIAKNRLTREESQAYFKSQDYGASLVGRGWQLGFTRSRGSGDTFQRTLASGPLNPADLILPLLFAANASNSTTSANASLAVTRSLSLRGVWRLQDQLIDSLLSSRFEEREATFEWRFRKVRVEASYLLYRYQFGTPIFRQSIVLRISRDFRVF